MIAFYIINLAYLFAQKAGLTLTHPHPRGPLYFWFAGSLCMIGLIYFMRSRRVKHTFIR